MKMSRRPIEMGQYPWRDVGVIKNKYYTFSTFSSTNEQLFFDGLLKLNANLFVCMRPWSWATTTVQLLFFKQIISQAAEFVFRFWFHWRRNHLPTPIICSTLFVASSNETTQPTLCCFCLPPTIVCRYVNLCFIIFFRFTFWKGPMSTNFCKESVKFTNVFCLLLVWQK